MADELAEIFCVTATPAERWILRLFLGAQRRDGNAVASIFKLQGATARRHRNLATSLGLGAIDEALKRKQNFGNVRAAQTQDETPSLFRLTAASLKHLQQCFDGELCKDKELPPVLTKEHSDAIDAFLERCDEARKKAAPEPAPSEFWSADREDWNVDPRDYDKDGAALVVCPECSEKVFVDEIEPAVDERGVQSKTFAVCPSCEAKVRGARFKPPSEVEKAAAAAQGDAAPASAG